MSKIDPRDQEVPDVIEIPTETNPSVWARIVEGARTVRENLKDIGRAFTDEVVL